MKYCGMSNDAKPVGHFCMPGYYGGLSVGAGFFEDEDYCPSFSILLGREELA